MSNAKNKTSETKASVSNFMNAIDHEQRKKDAKVIMKLMRSATQQKPKMWGPSIVGFGKYHFRYASGREGDFMKIGFSPRKTSMTIYIMPGFDPFTEIMSRLGKYKISKSCLYIKKMEDVDEHVLLELMKSVYGFMTERYG